MTDTAASIGEESAIVTVLNRSNTLVLRSPVLNTNAVVKLAGTALETKANPQSNYY